MDDFPASSTEDFAEWFADKRRRERPSYWCNEMLAAEAIGDQEGYNTAREELLFALGWALCRVPENLNMFDGGSHEEEYREMKDFLVLPEWVGPPATDPSKWRTQVFLAEFQSMHPKQGEAGKESCRIEVDYGYNAYRRAAAQGTSAAA